MIMSVLYRSPSLVSSVFNKQTTNLPSQESVYPLAPTLSDCEELYSRWRLKVMQVERFRLEQLDPLATRHRRKL